MVITTWRHSRFRPPFPEASESGEPGVETALKIVDRPPVKGYYRRRLKREGTNSVFSAVQIADRVAVIRVAMDEHASYL